MQYNVTCNKCNRTFTITADGGESLQCTCPYCGQSLFVNLPSQVSPVAPVGQREPKFNAKNTSYDSDCPYLRWFGRLWFYLLAE